MQLAYVSCFVEDLDRTRSGGPITDAMCLLSTVSRLDAVGPNKVKNGGVILHSDGVAEHMLFVILVQLEVLRSLPVFPVGLSKETAPGESHDLGCVVENVARLHNVVTRRAAEGGAIGEEVKSVIKLVVGKLGEIFERHDGEAFVRDVRRYFRVREDKSAKV
jgi:hypothetical protein